MAALKSRHRYRWYNSIIWKCALMLTLVLIPIYLLTWWMNASYTTRIWASSVDALKARDEAAFASMAQQLNEINLAGYTLLADENLIMLQQLKNDRMYERISQIKNNLGWLHRVSVMISDITIYLPKIEMSVTQHVYHYMSAQELADAERFRGLHNRLCVIDGGIYSAAEYNIIPGSEKTTLCVMKLQSFPFTRLANELAANLSGCVLYVGGQACAHKLPNGLTPGDIPPAVFAAAAENITLGDNSYYAYSLESEALGLKIIRLIPPTALTDQMRGINRVFPLLIAATLIFFTVFLWYLRRYIQNPVRKLIVACDRLERGDISFKTEYRYVDEFTVLYDSFNRMGIKLNDTLEQVYAQKLKLKQSELKQLQTQIDPHFLFNTFFILVRRIRRNDSEGAMLLAEQLGQYFMYITRNGKDYISLKHEYNHALIYARIQSTRYSIKLKLNEAPLPEELCDIVVPRLILQPFVENTIKYVVELSDDPVTLAIRCEADGEFIDVFVEDSGDVLTDAQIERMNAVLDSGADETTALINIDKRLKLCYGGACGVRFSRSALGGLCSRVRINRNGGHADGENIGC